MNIQGQVQGIELATYLQMLAAEKKTYLLNIRSQKRIGLICMRDGVLYSACSKDLNNPNAGNQDAREKHNEDAVMDMLCWQDPTIQVSPLVKETSCQITKSLEFLIIESCRISDEGDDSPDLSDHSPAEMEPAVPGTLSSKVSPVNLEERLQGHPEINSYVVMDSSGKILAKDNKREAINADFVSFVHYSLKSMQGGCKNGQTSCLNLGLKKDRCLFFCCSESHIFGLDVNPAAEAETLHSQIEPLFTHLSADLAKSRC